MAGTHVGTTERSGLTMEQVGGNDVYKMYNQLHDYLANTNLGTEYVELFTYPEENGKVIDWYAEKGSQCINASELTPQEREALLGKLSLQLNTLKAYADNILNDPGKKESHKQIAKILNKATIIPQNTYKNKNIINPDKEKDPPYLDYVYSVDGNPVLIGWGFTDGDNSCVDGITDLIKAVDRSIDVEKAKREKAAAERAAKEAAERAAKEAAEKAAKEAAEKEAAEKAAKEAAEKSAKEAADKAAAEQAAREAAEKAAADKAAREASEKTREEKSQVQNAVVAPTPQPQEKSRKPIIIFLLLLLAILLAAAWFFLSGKQPLDFVKGDWNVEGVLHNVQGKEIGLKMNFPGSDGVGTASMSIADNICTGPVKASLGENNRLIFQIGQGKCPDGDTYEPVTLNCSKDSYQCTGTNQDGQSWQINLRK